MVLEFGYSRPTSYLRSMKISLVIDSDCIFLCLASRSEVSDPKGQGEAIVKPAKAGSSRYAPWR